ncbi:MAG: hypothetical protein ABMA64_16805 [Myxococcota bacterium]
MKNVTALFALAAIACNGDTGDKTSGETGTTGSTCDTVYSGPISISTVNVTCDAADNVTFYAETVGWTGDGQVYAMDTANVSPWSEEHDIKTYEFDACGAWDKLDLTITSGPYPGTDLDLYQRNTSSFFSCSEHYGQPVMTYAFMVYDDQGVQADCVAAGDDAAGFAGGAYDGDMQFAPGFDHTACTAGALGR